MATVDKSKSQTYNFLSENKSIEDIKQQRNIEVIKKSRHGGSSFKLVEKNNANHQPVNDGSISENNRKNLEPVTSNLTNDEKDQEINNDIWTKFKNYLNWPISNTEELIQTQKKYIEQLEQSNLEKDKEIQQIKKENEELKIKRSNVNFDKFKYNVVTILDEKQSKKTGINKIHEEILSINNELYFITTFVNTNKSITEEILTFHNINDDNLEIIKQTKYYKNINEYKSNIFLIDEQKQNLNKIIVKDFLKQQQDFKLKPTKVERTLWCIFTIVTLLIVTSTLLLLVPPIASIPVIAIPIKVTAGIMGGIRIFASLFSPATRKVDVWFGNKFYKNKEQKEKEKNERQSTIKDIISDKLETKLQTQYDILKQELDNRKNMKPDKLISYKIINQNSNSILENSNIESENNKYFDSSIRNTVNNQDPQPSTNSRNNWNKVKCLLTT